MVMNKLYLKMNTLISNFKKLTASIIKTNPRKFLLPRVHSDKSGISEEDIEAILKKKFPDAKQINVKDVSGGCGAMFDILVEAKEFNGLSIMKQHRAIYDALDSQIKQIHGLHIVTKAVK